ncbi:MULTISPECIES: glycerophosphodiester phosphodiesterase [unclassified Sphingobium]|uniref:glycerophosphodiester phosphodiesterase n=1 Tax=unclassified Sphingobium TaxID=2611147 RepID=UPI0022242FBE|nr:MULTISPECIES: glycerophosphodiester phosphodiesterase [unclassified Sphingobium]MCW2396237.1 glycerophosphoryl diester phosphodiesterase [Sphingobium sp. B8D3B]MCW2419753.1 glycerophosphoryl diester phosphodiesterase [Sphingobium sp. B8D3C]
MLTRRDAIGLGVAALATPAIGREAGRAQTLDGKAPLVFAHRGASAMRPEHTLESYGRAIADGADFIEPDLVMTRDGVLVARHENEIGGTIDVAKRPEFADRRTTKQIDGEAVTGWFTEDFSLAELKTLRAVERLGAIRPESQSYDGQFPIPTLDEIIAFVAVQAGTRGKAIGLIPEIKHSTYFASIGLPLEDALLSALAGHDYTRRCPIVIQSFETTNLRAIRQKIGRPTNIQLLQLFETFDRQPADAALDGLKTTYGDMASPAGLAAIADYADAIGPSSRSVMPLDAEGRLAKPARLVADAHAAGLRVYLYTFRPENRFLPSDLRGPGGENARHEAGSVAEIRRYLSLGVDGFFTDDPALGRLAVDGA